MGHLIMWGSIIGAAIIGWLAMEYMNYNAIETFTSDTSPKYVDIIFLILWAAAFIQRLIAFISKI